MTPTLPMIEIFAMSKAVTFSSLAIVIIGRVIAKRNK